MIFKQKPPYTQEEIGDQIHHIDKLINQQERYPSELGAEAVATAREVLAFMLDEIKVFQSKK